MKAAAAAWTALVIVLVVSTLYLLAALITVALRLPWDMSLPPALRVLGLVPVIAGSAMLAWLFRYRRVVALLVSTYARALGLKLSPHGLRHRTHSEGHEGEPGAHGRGQ